MEVINSDKRNELTELSQLCSIYAQNIETPDISANKAKAVFWRSGWTQYDVIGTQVIDLGRRTLSLLSNINIPQAETERLYVQYRDRDIALSKDIASEVPNAIEVAEARIGCRGMRLGISTYNEMAKQDEITLPEKQIEISFYRMSGIPFERFA